MVRSTFHLHTTFCDGSQTPAELTERALQDGMTALGFSAHAAWPFASAWHLSPSRYAEYAAAIESLKEAYSGRIEIYRGFEADYIAGITFPDKTYYREFTPDYLIGSVHYVALPRKKKNVPLWCVDAPTEEVARGLEECYSGNGKKAVEAYWGAVREMIESCDFDFVGHIDVVRKRNAALRFFDEDAGWYRNELKETVKTLARKGRIVEINTGGIARKTLDDTYPSQALLSLLNKASVPLTLNSDAHSGDHLLCAYERAVGTAKEAGYSSLLFLKRGAWQEAAI